MYLYPTTFFIFIYIHAAGGAERGVWARSAVALCCVSAVEGERSERETLGSVLNDGALGISLNHFILKSCVERVRTALSVDLWVRVPALRRAPLTPRCPATTGSGRFLRALLTERINAVF